MATAAAASSSTESSEWDWQKRLDQLQKRFDAYKTEPQRDIDEEDYGDEDEGGGTPWQILQSACTVANKAQVTEHPDTPQILERVQELSNTVVKVATKKQLGYAGLKSFADGPGTLVKDSMHSFMGHADGKSHVCPRDAPTDSRRAYRGQARQGYVRLSWKSARKTSMYACIYPVFYQCIYIILQPLRPDVLSCLGQKTISLTRGPRVFRASATELNSPRHRRIPSLPPFSRHAAKSTKTSSPTPFGWHSRTAVPVSQ